MSLKSIILVSRDKLTGFWSIRDLGSGKKTIFENKERCMAGILDFAGYGESHYQEALIRELAKSLEGADRQIISPMQFDSFICEYLRLILEKM